MGGDIFYLTVKNIDSTGRKVTFDFESVQHGLAPEGRDAFTKAYWVTAVLAEEAGAFRTNNVRRTNKLPEACCPLSLHPKWTKRDGKVRIEGLPKDLTEEKLREVVQRWGPVKSNQGARIVSWSDTHAEGVAWFDRVEDAEKCVQELNGNLNNMFERDASQSSASNLAVKHCNDELPGYIHHCDYDYSLFDEFINEVKLLEFEGEEDDDETTGVYEVEFSESQWASHLIKNARFAGG
eukprot:GHVN01063796.1.p1 GENE.GHVN01063796.1~~GHVN01063796.1.p1  ORF type:complete len:237 (+),score=26.70 GHVN01063796.1:38-748(+)